jgi:hypothetical protein
MDAFAVEEASVLDDEVRKNRLATAGARSGQAEDKANGEC